jgi:hypothetical protein
MANTKRSASPFALLRIAKSAWLAFVFAFVFTSPPAWPQAGGVNADVVRKAILDVPIWHVDRGNGVSLWHFEMRGDKLWATIAVIGGKNFGSIPIEVTTTGLTLLDPDGLQITLRYDPKDIQFPFKGADTQGKPYELTPK